MTNSRSEDILRRHRYRPLIELATPALGIMALVLTAAGVGLGGGTYRAADPSLGPDLGELPARAECVHVADIDTSAG